MTVFKTLLFLLLITFVYVAKAQTSVGLEAGASAGYLNTNISNRAAASIDYYVGYTIDVPVQFKINNWLYLETCPNITQKNYAIDRTDSLAGAYENFINTYLQLPVMAKFIYGKRLQVFADAGFYCGYWLAGRVNGLVPDIYGSIETTNANGQSVSNIQLKSYNEKYQFNSEIDNRVEFGWAGGIGAQYHLNKKYQLIFSCKDYQSLTDQQKKNILGQVPQYNQTFTFSVGGLVSFK